MSKEKVQKAISLAGQRLAEIVKVIEQHGAELTDAELDKAFVFLKTTLLTVEEKARSARALSIASSGRFDFDMDVPVSPAPHMHSGGFVGPAGGLVGAQPLPHVAPTTQRVMPRPPVASAPPLTLVVRNGDHARPIGRISKHSPDGDAGEVLVDLPEAPRVVELGNEDVTFIDN